MDYDRFLNNYNKSEMLMALFVVWNNMNCAGITGWKFIDTGVLIYYIEKNENIEEANSIMMDLEY